MYATSHFANYIFFIKDKSKEILKSDIFIYFRVFHKCVSEQSRDDAFLTPLFSLLPTVKQ